MNEDDSDLHAQWQRHSREMPPPALDDAIRAAAHRAVHAKPSAASARARAPWSAWATFAAAASIGAIAIGVWQLQPRDVDDTRMVASDIPTRSSGSATDAKSASQPRAEGRIAGEPAAANTPAPAQATAPALRGTPADREKESSAATAQDKVSPTFAAAPPPVARPAPEDLAGNGTPAERDQRASPAAARGALADRKKEGPTIDAPAMRADVAQAPAAPSPFPAGGAAGAPREQASALQKTQSAPARPAAPALGANAASGAASDATSNAATAPSAAAPARSAESSSAMKRSDASEKLAAAGAPTSATALEASSATAKDRSIDDAIGRIRRALAEHRDADAAVELTAMRARFDDADARLPADLRAWAAQVPRVQR